MAEPLTRFKHRIDENWLVGCCADEIAELAEQRYQELLQYDHPSVLLVDRHPTKFLAGLIAACSTPCHVFLCNPDWGQTEWQQVFELVDPMVIWGVEKAEVKRLKAKGKTNLLTPHSSLLTLIMIPTGGTSGKVRFAMHTWETLSASVEGFREYFAVDRVNSFCVLPLYHVSGLMQFMRSFLSNGKLVILPWKELDTGLHVDPQNFFLSLVPTQLQRCLYHADWLARFKTILLGGAPAWDDLLEQARLLQLSIAPTYGMTETASQIATLKPKAFLAGQTGCGQVLPHAKITIHPDTQKLAIQAKSLMLGYYPVFSNESTYDPDDLGFFDDRNQLHILGRDSNKIITGGENVFPAEVEAAIRSTRLVKDVCVLGLPDPSWGQTVAAFYVPQYQAVSEGLLSQALQPQLSKFKQPKHWIAIDALPRNAQGKVNHEALKQFALSRTRTG